MNENVIFLDLTVQCHYHTCSWLSLVRFPVFAIVTLIDSELIAAAVF